MMASLQIARVCHDANRAYCITLGDNSQRPWDQAADWQKESAIKGVQWRMANPDAPASAQHEAWLKEKETDGWKYGAVKNADTKEHPCFVPYEQLPEEQKVKDNLFVGIVNALK